MTINLKKFFSKIIIISMLFFTAYNTFTYASITDSLNLLVELNNQFKDSNLVIVPVPTSLIISETNNNQNHKYSSQVSLNDRLELMFTKANLKVSNCCDEIIRHKDEYLYFRSDSHWQSRGAYYAYKEFCKTMGYNCAPLESYNEVIINDKYLGDKFKDTSLNVMDDNYDELIAYISSVSNTMTIYDNKNRIIKTAESCINEKHKTYFGVFLEGTGNFTEIVTSNESKKTAVVIKDSFGFPFIPYLVSNYSKIYVIDPRYTSINIKNKMKNIKVDDIIVVCANYLFNNQSFAEGMYNMLYK